jgi:hypothetical protein
MEKSAKTLLMAGRNGSLKSTNNTRREKGAAAVVVVFASAGRQCFKAFRQQNSKRLIGTVAPPYPRTLV